VHASPLGSESWRVSAPAGEIDVKLALPGTHNVRNALAAAAAAIAAGARLDSIKAGLESVKQVHGRLVMRELSRGGRLLDDTYNANPGSLAAALEVLAAQPGERWLVLGDMAELGAGGEVLHRRAGELARASGVSRLYAFGALSQAAGLAFGTGARSFDSRGALARALIDDLAAAMRTSVSILVKGSRSQRMEKVIEALLAEDGAGKEAEHNHAA
jgi:UDP-N-acetylmuramoyl-tripeptide--D-alanyl-D-alanine ligase